LNFFSLFKRNIIYRVKKKHYVDQDKIKTNSLDKLFHFYGSDKANTIKETNNTGHGYSNFYSKHFKNLKNKKINILEIGSYSGASAASFIKYLPDSKVFCFDINISNFKYSSKNISVYGLDINNKKKVQKSFNHIFKINKFKNFDLIIDDGSHNLSDILFSFNYFFKYLKNGGTFVIEDFKHPNFYLYNRNVKDILVDELLKKLKEKEFFKSKLINEEDQKYLMNSIDQIENYKGFRKDSYISFIKKK
jgi:predicted O-methyltransferase YrrM